MHGVHVVYMDVHQYLGLQYLQNRAASQLSNPHVGAILDRLVLPSGLFRQGFPNLMQLCLATSTLLSSYMLTTDSRWCAWLGTRFATFACASSTVSTGADTGIIPGTGLNAEEDIDEQGNKEAKHICSSATTNDEDQLQICLSVWQRRQQHCPGMLHHCLGTSHGILCSGHQPCRMDVGTCHQRVDTVTIC